jgi:hypothetical protein
MHQVRCAKPPSRIGADLRAMLTAIGPGDDVLGGVALVGLSLPGLNLVIDSVLVLPRGLIVVSGVDLPGPALRLEAPNDGPWLVDGWRLVRPGSPIGGALAAASAVGARLEAPGAPALPLSAVVAVGPYVREVVRPDGDAERAPIVLHPTPRLLVRMVTRLARAPHRCDVPTAGALLGLLAPGHYVPPEILATEGFAGTRTANDQASNRTGNNQAGNNQAGSRTGNNRAGDQGLNRELGRGGRW